MAGRQVFVNQRGLSEHLSRAPQQACSWSIELLRSPFKVTDDE